MKWLRRLMLGAAAVVALATTAVAWLLRDPIPGMLARRSRLSGVDTLEMKASGSYTEQVVRVRASSGLSVELALRIPRDPASEPRSVARRRAVFLLLGGYRAGKDAAAVIDDTKGSIVVGLQYPYSGSSRLKGLAVLPAVPKIRRAILDTPPAIMLALDYLVGRADVDTARVEVVGASFGAPFGAVATALDPRITRLWLLHGGADPYRLIEHNLRKSIPFAPARACVAALATVLASGPRLDPAAWVARVSPRPVVMINAREDERIPRETVDALYAAAREPKEQHWLAGRHMQRNRRDVLQQLVNTVFDIASRGPSPSP